MPSSRSCRSSYDCIVKIKGVTMRPILFSQLMRSDGEGAMNPEELFADDRSPASEQERVHEDELHSLMRSILDWAISFLSESSQGTIRAIYFEGKTVKQHSEEEYVTVYAIYKRLARSYPVIKEIVLEELEGLDDETRAHLEYEGQRKTLWQQKRAIACERYGLSPREREILQILLKGRDAKYITDTFYISQSTAKTHIYNIYRKFGIHSRQELLDFIEDIEVPADEEASGGLSEQASASSAL